MHIVQVYFSKVPVLQYGGMERVIESLCEGYLELGHQVTLICYQGEYEIPGVNAIDLNQFSNMDEAKEKYHTLIPKDADVVHYHVPILKVNHDIPYVCTMHGNLKDEEAPDDHFPENMIFISKNHATRHQRKDFVYNGLNPKLIPLNDSALSERLNFSFLGRAKLKRKGLHHAKAIAKHFKLPLMVGGKSGLNLFGNTRYLGQLNNEQKFKMLGESRAMLFPIEWEEPFGLVMIEAMFCGTPVFALKRGSVEEVLGQEGHDEMFIHADTKDALINKIKSYKYLAEPKKIRDYAVKHFSHLAMCEGYLNYYQKLLKKD